MSASYISQIANNVDFYIKSVAVSKMSIVAMIKGKLKMQNSCTVTNQPSFFASFESTVLIDRLTISSLTIASADIVFHLLSTSFTITNSMLSSISCTTLAETIF